jgi:hypothetical protein
MSELSDTPDWMEVRLHDYFDRMPDIDDASDHMRYIIREWCKQNVEVGEWKHDGITFLSYRVYFKNPEDVTMFKLKFGV